MFSVLFKWRPLFEVGVSRSRNCYGYLSKVRLLSWLLTFTSMCIFRVFVFTTESIVLNFQHLCSQECLTYTHSHRKPASEWPKPGVGGHVAGGCHYPQLCLPGRPDLAAGRAPGHRARGLPRGPGQLWQDSLGQREGHIPPPAVWRKSRIGG